MFSFLKTLKSPKYNFKDMKMTYCEVLLNSNLFWKKFDLYVYKRQKIEVKEIKKLRPEAVSFSAWDLAIGGWWALETPQKILQYVLLGYKPEFSQTPPMTFTYHQNLDNTLNKEHKDLQDLLDKDVSEGKMFRG